MPLWETLLLEVSSINKKHLSWEVTERSPGFQFWFHRSGTFGNLLDLSESQFSHLCNGDNNHSIYFIRRMWGFNEMRYKKCQLCHWVPWSLWWKGTMFHLSFHPVQIPLSDLPAKYGLGLCRFTWWDGGTMPGVQINCGQPRVQMCSILSMPCMENP